MERSDFIALLKSENQFSEEIALLKKKYPYASILHHIDIHAETMPEQIRLAAIYKKDPLKFAKRININVKANATKGTIESESIASQSDATKSNVVEEVIKEQQSIIGLGAKSPLMKAKAQQEQKEKAQLREKKLQEERELKAQAERERKAQETKEKQAAEERLQKAQAEKDAKLKAEKERLEQKTKDEQADPIKPKEDILEIISELPDENPIKKKSIFEAHIAETPEETKQVEAEENNKTQDPKDLLVMMSFMDWLQHFKAKNEDEIEDERGKRAIRSAWQKEKLAEAMDDDDDEVPEQIFKQAMSSISMSDSLVSEPLAELYAKQGKVDKAADMYKKLSLLNPEKSAYFASKIKELHLSK